jgi:hypothetical protein
MALAKCQAPLSKGILWGLPQAQANIPYLGTLEQGIFYLKPQAHSFHGLSGIQ